MIQDLRFGGRQSVDFDPGCATEVVHLRAFVMLKVFAGGQADRGSLAQGFKMWKLKADLAALRTMEPIGWPNRSDHTHSGDGCNMASPQRVFWAGLTCLQVETN